MGNLELCSILCVCVCWLVLLCAGGCWGGGLGLPHDPSTGPHQCALMMSTELFCVCVFVFFVCTCSYFFCVPVGVGGEASHVSPMTQAQVPIGARSQYQYLIFFSAFYVTTTHWNFFKEKNNYWVEGCLVGKGQCVS